MTKEDDLHLIFQLKFKRRVYKMLNLDEKQLKSINSKANMKKFLEHVMANNVEKVNKMCNKGLDPNFHCQESGGEITERFISSHSFYLRDSSLPDIRDQVPTLPDGDGSGQWWSHPGLPDARREHGHAPRSHNQQPGDREDNAGAGGLAQLQGQQEPHPALPRRHPGDGPRHHRDSPARPRRDGSSGPPGLAGGSSGERINQTFRNIIRRLFYMAETKIPSITSPQISK